MPYSPQPPISVSTLEEMRSWLNEELRSIALAINETQVVDLRPSFKAPDRLRDGVMVYADGTNFNPGSGEGPYIWDGAAWKYMLTPSPRPISSLNPRLFTSSGTYTPSAGTLSCMVECIGGGAAGGGVTAGVSSVACCSGGGSGGYSKRLLTAAQIAVPITITIGAGGIGVVNGTGGPGGDTSFGSLCIAKGGLGGSASGIQGGAGGDTVGAVGDIVAGGDPGEGCMLNNNYPAINGYMFGGAGGSSFLGGGAQGVTASGGSFDGLNARNYGSGGSGGFVNQVVASVRGGNGSAGAVIVTEFK